MSEHTLRRARLMASALLGAGTLEELRQLYVDWLGELPGPAGAPPPAEDMRGDLADHIREFCFAQGVHCADVGLDSAFTPHYAEKEPVHDERDRLS